MAVAPRLDPGFPGGGSPRRPGKPGSGKGGGLPGPDGVVITPGGSGGRPGGTSSGFGGGANGPGVGSTGGRGSAAGRLLGGDLGEGAGGRGAAGEGCRGLGGGKGSGVGGLGNAAAAESAAARATGAGARGAGGIGPTSASGRHGDDEDGEHHRPDFLIEPDLDALFGTGQRTTPPVIGE